MFALAGLLLCESQLFEQGEIARFGVKRGEDTILFEPTHPLGIGSIGLLKIKQRQLAITKAEVDQRLVKRKSPAARG